MINIFLKNTLYFLRGILGFFKKNKGAIVLMYHSVGENSLLFTVKKNDFENQMKYLKDNNFNVISTDELFECFEKKKIPAKTVIITFDDGYEDNFLNAFPILKKYNFPATIFVNTNLIGREIDYRGTRIKLLNWEETKMMEDSGLIDIEPHTMNHLKLHKSSVEGIEKEVVGSRVKVEQMLNKKCHYFAYPSGRYSQNVVNILKNNNFKLAFTVNKGLVNFNNERLLLNRNSIDSKINLFQFKNIALSGRI